MLYLFINGDNTVVDQVFRKDETKSTSENVNTSSNASNIELRVTLQSAIERITELENCYKENYKEIKDLKSENQKLRSECDSLNEKNRMLERKFAQYDASKKLTNQKTKAIGEFDFEIYRQCMSKIESEIARHEKVLNSVHKSLKEIRLECMKPYAEKCSPSKAPLVSNGSNSNQNVQGEIVNTCNDTTQTVSQVTHSSVPVNTNGKTDNPTVDNSPETRSANSEAATGNTALINKIPVRVQGVTENLKLADDNFFTGVSKRKTARYYLSNINSKSTRQGILHHLEKNNVQVTYLRIFKQRDHRFVSAKLNVVDDDSNVVEAQDFWPAGVHCRYWYSNKEWQEQCSDTQYDAQNYSDNKNQS